MWALWISIRAPWKARGTLGIWLLLFKLGEETQQPDRLPVRSLRLQRPEQNTNSSTFQCLSKIVCNVLMELRIFWCSKQTMLLFSWITKKQIQLYFRVCQKLHTISWLNSDTVSVITENVFVCAVFMNYHKYKMSLTIIKRLHWNIQLKNTALHALE